MASNEHKFLTNQKITEILRKINHGSDVELLEAKTLSLASLGKNYSGDIIFCDVKAKVDGKEEKEYHWAVKTPPMEMKERLAMHRRFMMEKKEMVFYERVLPALKKLAKEREANFFLNCFDAYYTEIHDEVQKGSLLVMENLKHKGFTDDIDKSNGLDIHHAKLALEELAKFHALGYALVQSYPDAASCIKEFEPVFSDYLFGNKENKALLDSFSSSMVKGMRSTLEVVQEPGQDFVTPVMEKLDEESIGDLRARMYTAREGEFNTLTHGDAHLNNIVFKYDAEDKPLSASWLDIAVTRYANPAGDLAYFLYSSTTPQLRQTHLNYLLGHYHDTLARCLAQLKENPAVWPFRQLLKDFDNYSYLGFLNSLSIVPTFFVKREDSIDQSHMNIDWNDPKQVQKAFLAANAKLKKAYEKVPQVKTMIVGNFLDMVQRGHLELLIN